MSRPAILVVDDDHDLADLVAWMLEAEGYRVRTAANGAEALRALETFDPALILLDMRMPIMDGWRFASELGARGRHPPIVVMTAAEDAHVRAKDIGAPHWLAKPFEVDALLGVVRTVIGPPELTATA